jgi:mannose-6-phosphate isomerase-like protein (cupin superfamily)
VSLSPDQLERFARDLAAKPERWSDLVHHAENARVYSQIWDSEEVNAWLICWSMDQDTGFHDHDESAAGIAVISGHVREERLRLGAPPTERLVGPGETFTVPREAIHRVLHAGDRPAVTIHAYSPPLTRTGAYRVGPEGELERLPQSGEEELRTGSLLAQ